MSRIQGDLPTWQEKKELLYNQELSVDDSELVEIATRLENAGRLNDALEFFFRAQDVDGIKRLENRAVKEGNFFLYTRCRDLSQQAPDPERVRRLAQSAMDEKKYAYAYRAYMSVGDEGEAQEAREILKKLLPSSELLFEEDDS